MQIRFDDLRPDHRSSIGFIDPVEVLATESLAEVREVIAAADARAASGAWVAGFVSYEAAPGIDPVLVTHPHREGLPLVWFGVFDRCHRELVRPPRRDYTLGKWEPDQDRQAHAAALDTIHRLIGAGETYQVNYTLRMRGSFAGDAAAAYADLLDAQAGGFGAFIDLGDLHILSASPELFFRWDAGGITTRPMKGTIGRGRWPAEDETRRRTLVDSAKDRAENLMIVDLVRNDLGRIAEFGSVTATDLFAIERYETVWQMTSTIRAQPRHDAGLLDVLTGLFPSGSVTGAPKRRTMEIIRQLEPSPRGVYCGAVGLLAPPGSSEPRAQFNVAIRTVLVDSARGTAEYGTGGGITWDSQPAGEYDEALLKAAVLTHRPPRFSLLETMRWSLHEGVVRRRRHLARLQASAAYFGFPFPAADIEESLDALVGDTDLRVRLLLGRDGDVSVESRPLVTSPAPVRLAIDTVPVDPNTVSLFHKTTDRRVYEDAAARFPAFDDVVLVNGHGMATETTRANLAVRFGDRWVTPPVGDGCLPGILRAELVADGTLDERSIPVTALAAADAVAVLNSLRGWCEAMLGD